MSTAFYDHPLWRDCQRRPIWVVSLTEPEHRMRDAKAILHLRDFLPPTSSGLCTLATVTTGLKQTPRWPTVPADAAIVLVGRPSLFGSAAERLVQEATPPLLYSFGSKEQKQVADYRSIAVHGFNAPTFPCLSFRDQRKSGAKELSDLGIVYRGWSKGHPLAQLDEGAIIQNTAVLYGLPAGAVRYARRQGEVVFTVTIPTSTITDIQSAHGLITHRAVVKTSDGLTHQFKYGIFPGTQLLSALRLASTPGNAAP